MIERHIDDIGTVKSNELGVVINVGYGNLGMTPDEARDLGTALLDAADDADCRL